MNTRQLLAALVGAIVMFFWGFVFWAASPLPFVIMKNTEQEESFVASIPTHFPESGVYFFPGMPSDHTDQAALDDMMKRHVDGPIGMVFVRTPGVNPMSFGVMGVGFLHFLGMCLLGVFLVGKCALILPSYLHRLGAFTAIGVISSYSIDLSQPIWFHLSWSYYLMHAAFHLGTWLFGGAAMAAIMGGSQD